MKRRRPRIHEQANNTPSDLKRERATPGRFTKNKDKKFAQRTDSSRANSFKTEKATTFGKKGFGKFSSKNGATSIGINRQIENQRGIKARRSNQAVNSKISADAKNEFRHTNRRNPVENRKQAAESTKLRTPSAKPIKTFYQKKYARGFDKYPVSENHQILAKHPEHVTESEVRLNRYISNAGVCSRREADKLILQGLVEVNGRVVTELGTKVQPGDVVKYDGKVLRKEPFVYILLNKPKDYITTTDDPQDRKTVMSLIAGATKERIYPVGRLDRNTTGLLLLTNDGELTEKLAHPSNKVAKVYQVDLDKPITQEDVEKIKKGVHLEDGIAYVDEIQILSLKKDIVGVSLHIGKNRIVRRIFEHLGYTVVRLDRVMYAGLTKKNLPRGHWRYLTEKEIINLKYLNGKVISA